MSFRDDEYILIQGWMINKLKLKGNDLLVYAIIYRYSQDDVHKFYGSLQYLADWTNSTINGVQNNLKNLLDAKLIFKEKLGSSVSSRCEYWVNTDIQLSCNDIQNTCNDVQLSCTNNIVNNKIINDLFISKDINKEQTEILEKNIYFENHKTSRGFKVLNTWITLYVENKELCQALKSWLQVMFNNRKIATLEVLKNKIDILFNNLDTDEQRIKAVKDATDKIWFTFQYSVEKIKKNSYNSTGIVLNNRDNLTLDLSDEVF